MKKQYLLEDGQSDYSFLDKLHAKLCGRVYMFLYKLTGVCEDRKLKRDIANALKEADRNSQVVDYLEEQKENILGGIEELQRRIIELENEVSFYKRRENMLNNSEELYGFYERVIKEIRWISTHGTMQDLELFLQKV